MKANSNKILSIAIPVMISSLTQNVINVVDTLFVSNIGNIALGAVGNGGIFYLLLSITGMGLTTGSQIIIGRRNGEKNFRQIGQIFDHTLILVFLISIIFFLFIQIVGPTILSLFTKSTLVLGGTISYVNIRSYGILFALLQFCISALFVGITNTKPLIYASVIVMFTNVVLDYVFINGFGGFSSLGINGAAYASVIAELTGVIFLFAYLFFKPDKKYNLFTFLNLNKSAFFNILKIGSPTMLQNFLTLFSWFAFFTIIEKIGESELALSHVLRSIYMVLMIPVFGFSSAVNTLVSNAIGRGEGVNTVFKIIKRVVLYCLVFVGFLTFFTMLFPYQIIALYSSELASMNSAVPSLNVISLVMYVYAIAFILFNGYIGTGSTKNALYIEATSISMYILFAYYTAVYLKTSLEIVWISEIVYFSSMAILAYLNLKKKKWLNNNL